ncbi:glutathione S-transferase family protein [Planktotalea sp.]|uniref:glutathione S-transferase family protein n=1 Tax=Planktotalea sp. TaxID=2029877 RepID=UPI003F6B73DB
MITVHHLNNSRSQRILWLLEELGVAYTIEVHQRDDVTNLAPPSLIALHPLGKSPMIEVDGRLITESGAIVEYLCACYGPHMIPNKDTDAHIRHLEMMHFAEGSAMIPILLQLYVGKLGGAGEPLAPRIKHQLESHFDYMEGLLRPSCHFVQDELSAADIMLSFPAEIAVRQNRSNRYPKLTAFVDHIQSRPAYKRAIEKGGKYAFA